MIVFLDSLIAKVNVVIVGVSKGEYVINTESLSQKWLILSEAAKRTVKQTTQRYISKILRLSLSCQFNTNDRALSYSRQHKNVFTDTI